MKIRSIKLSGANLMFRLPALLVLMSGLAGEPAAVQAQTDETSSSRLPPEPVWPSPSHYYEARITSEGYALYIPFFIPRAADSGEGSVVRPPWKEREPRYATERDPVGAVGRFEVRTREEIIPGEFIRVYRPAVYELDEKGEPQLVEDEEIVTLPKVRIVLERVWVSGLSTRELLSESPEAAAEIDAESPDAGAEFLPIRREPQLAK